MPSIPVIFIIAGEASGDQLGADLMRSLKDIQEVRFVGVGGEAMIAQGLQNLFPMQELSIMGVLGIVRNLPLLLKRMKFTLKTIQILRPTAVITIDAPEFSFRILKSLHKLACRPKLIHYVAPTVWAWRPGRAKTISRFIDHLLCLYPFEPPLFEKYGLKATFVGHPIASETGYQEQRESKLLCVLPGSRCSEIETLLPIFGKTVALLKKEIPDLRVILPTLASREEQVRRGIQNWPTEVDVVVGDKARREAFQKATVALAASGTVALQLSAAHLPFIVAYKLGKVNEWIAKLLVKTPWACMVNILLAFQRFGSTFTLDRNAKDLITKVWIPEFLQKDCRPEKLASELLELIQNQAIYDVQIKVMDEAITLLKAPPQAAAKAVVNTINLQNIKTV